MKWSLLLLCCCVSLSSASEPVRDKRLLKKASFDVKELPLDEVLEHLAKEYSVPMEIADNAGEVAPKHQVTLQIDDVTLQSLLNLICDAQPGGSPWNWKLENRKVVFVPETDQREMVEVRYPLAPLGPLAAMAPQIDSALMKMSGPWATVDGIGGRLVEITPQFMTYSQSLEVHQEIDEILQQLQAAATGRRPTPSLIDRANERLAKKLLRRVRPEGMLKLQEFMEQHELPYFISPGLNREGVDTSAIELTFAGKQDSLENLLGGALQQIDLTYVIEHEVIKIVTQSQEDERLYTRVYDLRQIKLPPMTSAADVLVQLQRAPGTGPWFDIDGVGGAGEDLGPLLLIWQGQEQHEKIVQLLKGL